MIDFNAMIIDDVLNDGIVVAEGVVISYREGGSSWRIDGLPVMPKGGMDGLPAHLLRASSFYCPPYTEIEIARHRILSYTPCGVWIETNQGKKFVNLRCTKQWASTNEEEAIDQLWHRKQSQKKILESQLNEVNETMEVMQKVFSKKLRPKRDYYNEDY